jgi:L-alanine-DL-glutamate epimerase-like enolase superfamily enzyme
MTTRPGSEACIVGVDIALVALPIARPVVIGTVTWREREYAAIRVRLADGGRGDAFGYTRGLPLDVMLERLAPAVVSQDVMGPQALIDDLVAANRNAAAAMTRAFGLIDICMRDAYARHSGLPLWRLLGGARDRVPIVVVAGYGPDPVDEVRRLADSGFRHIKLHHADPPTVKEAIRALDGHATLGADAAMGWGSVAEAVAGCAPLDDLGLAFIEDPFPPAKWRMLAELADRLRTPLAAGEDAVGYDGLVDLLEGASVLRVDGTASGGFGAVLAAAETAAARGRHVMTHAFPDLHGHLAGSVAVEQVELIPDESGVNPIGQLLARRQRIEHGELVLSEEPGHGAPLDWEAVTRHARRMTTIGEESSNAA